MIINLPKIGPVQFRDNLSDEEFQAQLGQLSQKFGFQLPEKPQPGLMSLMGSGFKRSVGESVIGLTDVLPAMGANALGFNDYARGQMDEALVARDELHKKYPVQFKSYQDANTLGKKAGYVAETLGEVGGSALGTITPGLGAGMLGARLAAKSALKQGLSTAAAQQATQQAAKRSMYGGVYLGSLAQTTPEIFEGIYRETGKFEPGISALYGGISAALETIVPASVLGQLGSYGRTKLIGEVAKQTGAAPKVWKSIMGEASKSIPLEGLTESAQEMLSAHARQVAGSIKDVFHPDNIQQYKEAFVKGAIGGGAFGTVGGVGKYLNENSLYQGNLNNKVNALDGLRNRITELTPEDPRRPVLEASYGRLYDHIAKTYGTDKLQGIQPRVTTEMGPTGTVGMPGPLETQTTEPNITEPTVAGAGEQALVATPAFLKSIGTHKGTGIGKFILNKDMGNPEELSRLIQAQQDGSITGSAKQEAAYNKLLSLVPEDIVTQARQLADFRMGRTPQETVTQPLNIQPPEQTLGTPETITEQPVIPGAEPAPILPETPPQQEAPVLPPTPFAFRTKDGKEFAPAPGGQVSFEGIPHNAYYVDKKARPQISKLMTEEGKPRQIMLGYDNQGSFMPIRNLEDLPAGAEPAVGILDKGTMETVATFPAELEPQVGSFPVLEAYDRGQRIRGYVPKAPIKEIGEPQTTQAPTVVTPQPAVSQEQAAPQQTPIMPTSDALIGNLVAGKFINPKDPNEHRARKFFKSSQQPTVDAQLQELAYEYAEAPDNKKYSGAVDWARKALPPEDVRKLEGYIERSQKLREQALAGVPEQKTEPKQEAKGEPAGKRQVSVSKTIDEISEEDFYDERTPESWNDFAIPEKKREYEANPDQLGSKLHSEVMASLQAGDLSKALSQLSERSKSSVGKIASALSKYTGNVRVEFGERSKYDPATNTITLKQGASLYDLLHEATHAAVSHVIDKPSHPTTKKLNAIFNEVNKKVDPVYGTKNLQEFVAEAWSNGEFRKTLRETRTTAENKSLWDKFVDMLRSLFGLPARKADTTIDAVDKLIDSIVSEPPMARTGDSLFANSINDPKFSEKLFNGIDKTIKAAPLMNEHRATKFWAGLEKVGTTGKEVMYKSLNLSALGTVSERVFGKLGVDFSNTANLMSGYQEKLQEAAYPLHRRLQKFRQKPEYQKWSTLVHESSIADIDPSPAGYYKYKNNPDKLAQYKEFRRRYEALGSKEAKDLYNDLFKSYKTMNDETLASLEKNIMDSIPDKEVAKSAYKKLLQELAEVRIDHYVPLFRKGVYRLEYKLGGKDAVSFYESQAERDAGQRDLAKQGATNFVQNVNTGQEISRNPPDGTVIANVVKILTDSGVGQDGIDKFAQVVAKAFPETSLFKKRMHRKNIAGYVDDAAFAFDNVMSGTIHQLSRLKYMGDLQRLTTAMDAKVKETTGPDQEKARLLLQEFENRRQFIVNPNISAWAQLGSTGSFFWFLAANVSSAVVNLLQTPLIVFPQLAGEYGVSNAFKMLWNAADLYGHSGFKRKGVDIAGNNIEMNAMMSLENLVNAGKADKYRGLVARLKDYGFLQTSTARDAVISAERPADTFGGVSRAHYMSTLIGTFMFHHAERFNRETTAVAAYDLEMQKLANDKRLSPAEKEERAIQKAVRAVEYMHGAGHTLTGPSLGHSDLGKILMVFKRFAFSMYYLLFDTIKRALPVKGGTPEQIEGNKVARRQLLGTYGMAALFSGAKGLPLFWIPEMVYNALRDDDEDEFDIEVRRFLGDMPYKGPVNYYTNASIADRVGWEDLIFREAKKDKSDASTLSNYIESIGGAPYSIINNVFFRTPDLIEQGHYARAIETAIPTSMSNVLKGIRYGTEGVNTLRGDPVMGEVEPHTALAQVFGFAPADLSLKYHANAYRTKTEAKLMGMRDRLMRKYYMAYRMGDYDREMSIREELFALGDKHPELNISQDYIDRSVRAREAISADMIDGVTISKKFRDSLRDVF